MCNNQFGFIDRGPGTIVVLRFGSCTSPPPLPPASKFDRWHTGWLRKRDNFADESWVSEEPNHIAHRLFGLLCTALLIGWSPASPPLPPVFGLIYEGAIGQPRWTTSVCNPWYDRKTALSSTNHSMFSECEVVLPDLLLLYGLQPRPVLLFSLLPPLLLNSPNIFISKIILIFVIY